jgi:hypothetical protein
VLVRPPFCAGADEDILAALVQFHEGDLVSSRGGLEAALERLDERWPLARLVHFLLARLERARGNADRARVHLETAIREGGDLFPARWAVQVSSDLYPDSAPISRSRRPGPSGRRLVTAGAVRLLTSGLGLLRFRRSAVDSPPVTYERTALLALVSVLCTLALRLVDYRRVSMFIEYQALELMAPILSFVLTAFLATRLFKSQGLALRVTGTFYRALPVLLIVEFVGARLYSVRPPLMDSVVDLGVAAWSVALFLFILRAFDPRAGVPRLLIAGAIFIATWLVPMHHVSSYRLWYRPAPERPEDDDNGLAGFVFRQADRIHAAESALRPERPGVADLYFVGFAGWGAQDVFLHEAQSAQRLFDARFDTRGHSLVLSNDASVRDVLPMASALNLGHILPTVASQMNREEDVLFLFLTSHRSERGLGIQASESPDLFADGELSPKELRSLLDDAGIKWRVLMVSSCRSGVFVVPLENEFTLIATAAASDRLSFGCAPDKDFTAWGQAVIAEQLETERSFPTAFAKAAKVIKQRETAAGLVESQPQIHVGAAIEAKLRLLEARLTAEAVAVPTQ